MLEPLKQFICDECGGVISKPEDGYVEWISVFDDEKGKSISHGFRIVHRLHKSPLKNNNPEGCYKYGNEDGRSDSSLDNFMEDVNIKLTSFLDTGFLHNPSRENNNHIIDFPEFVDFSRRLTVPYYEEARVHFNDIYSNAYYDGHNPHSLFSEEKLKAIIEQFSG
ncbi:hypothetical protein [Bacteroides sedimenti]|uniref:Uncharacterized protein n=1 Tax=Bacteroides sedimenti TaxID=2136147 RepID=A0ABM8IG53_9BACE